MEFILGSSIKPGDRVAYWESWIPMNENRTINGSGRQLPIHDNLHYWVER